LAASDSPEEVLARYPTIQIAVGVDVFVGLAAGCSEFTASSVQCLSNFRLLIIPKVDVVGRMGLESVHTTNSNM